jgi:hypothetical protein
MGIFLIIYARTSWMIPGYQKLVSAIVERGKETLIHQITFDQQG